jgi:hypothetical protein
MISLNNILRRGQEVQRWAIASYGLKDYPKMQGLCGICSVELFNNLNDNIDIRVIVGVGHAFNKVIINDKVYFIDLTIWQFSRTHNKPILAIWEDGENFNLKYNLKTNDLAPWNRAPYWRRPHHNKPLELKTISEVKSEFIGWNKSQRPECCTAIGVS